MKNLKSIAGAVAFMVLWAGAAIAMPTTFFAEDESPSTVADLVAEEELDDDQGETEEVEVPDENEDGDVGDAEHPENHGKAVSTAAHCDLKGRAKGALVSSVARDKSATAESAQAACDAAVAEAESATPSATGKPSKPAKAPSGSDRGPKEKAPKPSEGETVPTDHPSSELEDTAVESGPPADSGSSSNKGGSKKP